MVLKLSPVCPMTLYSLYLILLLPIDLSLRWLLHQPIVLKIPKKADVENWMYCLQGRAVGDIQFASS